MCVIIVEGRSLLSYGIDVVYPRFQWARWSRWVICGDPSITMEEFGLQEVDTVLDVGVGPVYLQKDVIKWMVIGHLLHRHVHLGTWLTTPANREMINIDFDIYAQFTLNRGFLKGCVMMQQ